MKKLATILFCLIPLASVQAHEQVIDLTVHYKPVNFAHHKTGKAIAVNNQIPAPTLHFKQGDHVTINVRNLLDKETALHWHGLLVPWQMDGVKGINQHGIKPGETFRYQFTIVQSGTYWYHAHAGLQEQQGLYGALIIDPPKKPAFHYNRDFAVVLSDWSNTDPDRIMANLKISGDYYSPDFPLQPSLVKFIQDYRAASREHKQSVIDDYKTMQKMRMGIYDFSDVAYGAFLLNGHNNISPWIAHVKKGDVVRLRFIGAGAATLFHVKIPDAEMQMVHIDGNDIKPYRVTDFYIAPGETYDVLVRIKRDAPYLIYAESSDQVGAAYGALVSNNAKVNFADIIPFPQPPSTVQEMNNYMMMDMGDMSDMADMPDMDMDSETKYQPVVAAHVTNDPNKPIADTIKLELSGYMDKYMWFINGLPEYKAHPIVLQPNKRYRLVFTNNTMMHHPMHIHGHWMILRNGNGDHDPLLHTIDVPPGATMTADLDTDASGQWIFHCHFLYHMMAGMSRVVQYSSLIELMDNKIKPENTIKQTPFINRPIVRVDEARPIDPMLVKHPMAHEDHFRFANYLDAGINPVTNNQKINFKGMYGSDYNKLQLFVNDAEILDGEVETADIDIFAWRLLSEFWGIKGGVNYTDAPAKTPYWHLGIGLEGVMPYFIDTDIRTYLQNGSIKLDAEFSRDTQITNNFFIGLGIRSILGTKTLTRQFIGSGLNQMQYTLHPFYRVLPGVSVFAEYEREVDYGSYKKLQLASGGSATQNIVTFGLSILF